MASTTSKAKPTISAGLHAIWSEIERVLTAATGPLLILASMVAAADIFSHGALSFHAAWLPLAWAGARAAAVTIWLGVSYDQFLEARHKGESGIGWFTLAAVLFFVDLQTGILFGVDSEHIANVGALAQLNLSPLGWLIETGLLTVLLIPVHRAIQFNQKHESQPETQPTPQATPQPPIMFSAPPVAAPAFYHAPSVTSYHNAAPMPVPPPPPPPTVSLVPAPVTHPRRSDSGHGSPEKARRIELIAAWLRDDPAMSITDCERALAARGFSVSRATVSHDRREAAMRITADTSASVS